MRYEPIGVVAAVVPWNYPLLMATYDAKINYTILYIRVTRNALYSGWHR
jgi:hypothetical protein